MSTTLLAYHVQVSTRTNSYIASTSKTNTFNYVLKLSFAFLVIDATILDSYENIKCYTSCIINDVS